MQTINFERGRRSGKTPENRIIHILYFEQEMLLIKGTSSLPYEETFAQIPIVHFSCHLLFEL